MTEDKIYDVVIVGGGVVGSILSKWLTRAGHSVLLLEAGKGDAQTHYGYEAYVRNSYKYPNRPNSPYPQNDNAGMPGIPWPAAEEDSPPAWISPQQYWIQRGPVPFGSDYARALGGTSLHWLGVSMRHVPNDFKLQSKYKHGLDWPIGYDTLEPYYRRAEYELGVAADTREQSYLGVTFEPGYEYPMVSFPMTYFDTELQKDIQGMTFQLGGVDYPVQVVPTPQARNATPNPDARINSMTAPHGPKAWYQSHPQAVEDPDKYDPPYKPMGNPTRVGVGLGERCEGNSSCIPICPVQAKYNATKSLAMADETLLDLRVQSVASRILLDEQGENVAGIEYIHYHDDGPADAPVTVRGKLYVLAAHCVENAKLCLISDVANSSKQMGRNLMDHPYLNFSGLYPRKIWGYRGPDVTGGMPLLRDGEFRSEHASFRTDLGNWGWEFPKGAPASVVEDMVEDQQLYGTVLRKALEEEGPRHMRVGYLMEQLPCPENRVTVDMDGTYNDDLGIPRPIVHYSVDDYTLAGMEAATRFTHALFQRTGTELQPDTSGSGSGTYNGNTYHFWGSGHLIGTHIMGDDKDSSVVNSWQQSHDHANLFLAGCGSHPTSGTANPTLTMTALAFRTLEKLNTVLKEMED
jgi:choline dehydrogenase-like flavoprotein